MRPSRLHLADFPDSVYANELRRSNPFTLRFADPLEAEYLAVHVERVRLRVRLWFTLNAVLSLVFTSNQAQFAGLRSVSFLLQACVLDPFALVLLWLAWGRKGKQYFVSWAWMLTTVSTALISVFVAAALADGHVELLSALPINILGLFFFAGLLFRQAVVGCAVTMVCFLTAVLALHMPAASVISSMVLLTLTSMVGAVVHRDVEHSYRQNFLEIALVNELVGRDSLSGLMNRRAFDDHLARVWQYALRDQRLIAVLMIDVDHFKRYNDRWGHQGGDAALRGVADIIQGYARGSLDFAARYGGEEFAVILYDPTVAQVQDTAEQLRRAAQGLRIGQQGSQPGDSTEVTVSVGVGIVKPTSGRTPHGAVQLADEALYEAKRAGRNRVIFKGLEDYRLLDTGVFKSPESVRRRR